MSSNMGSEVEMVNPIAGMEPPKSRKKLWIFGGLGCMGVIVLCCGGIVAMGYYFGLKPMQEFQERNVDIAIVSPEAEALLGSPIVAGPVTPESSGAQQFTFRSNLVGPNGEGTLVFVGKLVGTEWVRESIYLEVDGQQTDLDPEAMFNPEIDLGL